MGGGSFFYTTMTKEKRVIDPKINEDELFGDLYASDRYVSVKRTEWDDKEKILYGKRADKIEDDTKSQVNDPRISTMLTVRANKVANQLPTGKPYVMDRKDRGKNMLMNVVLQNWILPNAKAQHSMDTKFWMMDLESLGLGSSFALVDWDIDKKRGYIGPNMFLIDIRDLFPQVGKLSLNESDYVQVSTLVSPEWLKTRDDKTWKNVGDVLEYAKADKTKSSLPAERISTRYATYYMDDKGSKTNKQIELVTRYERDKWITFAPDCRKVLRTVESEYAKGELPVVAKYCYPVKDDFFGLGEIERTETLQKALSSLINLYFDGVKMSIFPPLQINSREVTPSTIKMRAAAKWMVERPNISVQPTNISPRGIETFQSTYQYLLAALQHGMGMSDTSVSTSTDQTLGKTPQALKMQNQIEDIRDAQDRHFMEETVTEVVERMINLQANMQVAPVILTLFSSEIAEIQKSYPDIVEMFDSKERGRVRVDAGILKGKYQFEIDSGSMSRKDEVTEQEGLAELMKQIFNGAQMGQDGRVTSPVLQAMREKGKDLDTSEVVKRWIIGMGIQNWDKIVLEESQDDVGNKLDQLDQQLAQKEQELMGGQQGMGQDMGQQMPQQAMQQPMPQQMPQMMQGGLQ